jgi:hypothetical protein
VGVWLDGNQVTKGQTLRKGVSLEGTEESSPARPRTERFLGKVKKCNVDIHL